MKIEKRGNGYRVRKMINGNMHRILFDHLPSKREIDEVFSKIYAESPSGAVQGTFKDCALQYIAIKENVLSPSTVRSYNAMVRSCLLYTSPSPRDTR